MPPPKPRYAGRPHAVPIIPPAAVDELVRLFQAADWPGLEARAAQLTIRYPGNPLAWMARGKALLALNQHEAAHQALSKAVKLAPNDADKHNDLALALYRLGKLDQAETHFRRALAIDAGFVESMSNLGCLLHDTGRDEEALGLLRQAVALAPQSSSNHNNLGITLRSLKQLDAAVDSFQRARALAPQHLEATINLGMTFNDLHRFDEALLAYREALAIQPDSVMALRCLGRLLTLLGGRDADAIACLERVIALSPQDPDAWIDLGNVLLRTGPKPRWQDCFRQAQALRPLVTWPAANHQPEFEVLLLDTPGAGSTPVNYLVKDTPYTRHFYCVLPDTEHPVPMLRGQGQLLINIIADADNGAEILPEALALADALDLPTINHPRQILKTDREAIARLLKDTPACKVPRTLRLDDVALRAAAARGELDGLAMPLLVRLTGNHGGDDFEKVHSWAEVAAFVDAHGTGNYYLTEYANYQSPDGQYRKYRLICIDGEVYPYHLAIHHDWMVHHFRTDMGELAWKRDEEAAFLQDPHRVFDGPHWQALLEIARKTDLDYCGIDCGVDRDGDIVIFEVNATMLVHDEQDPLFSYKNPHVATIKAAFNAMVAGRVQRVPKARAAA